MGIKATLIKPLARRIVRQTAEMAADAPACQTGIFQQLLRKGALTRFGKDHQLDRIRTYEDFCQAVPVADYERLKPYFEAVKSGEPDVMWPGKPLYLAKTSGTTSGTKYIPITRDSLPNHFNTARNALFNYAHYAGDFSFFDGKMIFFSGSPELEYQHDIAVGRLSGIVNHQVPSWLQKNKLPSYDINCIGDWETKLSAIVGESRTKDLRLIGGIPPWVQMYYERLLEITGKNTVAEVFPNYRVYVHGGVNYAPYQSKLQELVGRAIHEVETYPASEGFIAFQYRPDEPALLLNADSGIFFEFIPVEAFHQDNPQRFQLSQVETGVQYAVVINSNAGLWGYSIGDTVEFTSTNPYLLRVTGRIKHFISAFGEHVIAKEVDQAILEAMVNHPAQVTEFTVAPQVSPPEGGAPYHEWFIEFADPPANPDAFARELDAALQKQNIYYKDLRQGNILRELVIRSMQINSFRNYMKSIGKLGEQNKVPRLTNDRKMADALATYCIN
ncbi:MAG: GH3 auxin-responsive promoter family protein [Saprospiraceae bacterium]|nr:GH3 auxin-responsive promoter family protein [Saprospiraceae bacterium]